MKLGIYGHGTENNNVSEMVLVDNYSRKPEDKYFILLYFFSLFFNLLIFPPSPLFYFFSIFPNNLIPHQPYAFCLSSSFSFNRAENKLLFLLRSSSPSQ